MYKDSSCRSSPQPPPTTTVAEEEDDDHVSPAADAQTPITTITAQIGQINAATTTTTTATATTTSTTEEDYLSCPSESSSDSEYEPPSRPSITSTSSTSSACNSSLVCRNSATAAPHSRARKRNTNVNADVRLLRKIGYIASRVRILAKFYGDFKLVNPYSPSKQRLQLQEIIEKHSIRELERELAKTELQTAPAHWASVVATAKPTQTPTETSIEEEDENDDSTTTTTVRRKSSTTTVSASIVVLEDLLIQFYEDHRSKITVLQQRRTSTRRQHKPQRRASTNGIHTNKFTKPIINSQNQQQQEQQQTQSIMSSTAAVNSSSVERLLQSSASPAADTDAENAYNNAKAVAAVAHFFNANSQQQSSQQQQQQQQQQPTKPQHRGSIFLQPIIASDDNNQRRRRASDCSATHLGQPLANQLQVTLQNNNCTTKFPYHRGSCGATGEHFLAANSIANRSTIILSKSCNNVDGGVDGNGGVRTVDTSAALYSSSDLRSVSSAGAAGEHGSAAVSGAGTGTAGIGTPSGHGNGNNEYSVVQLNNTIIQCHFNDDDFRALVKDLKRKVEYTERMNWLCLSKRPMGPPHRKSSIPKHQEVKKRFLEICNTTFSDEVKAALRLPAFDSYEWSDADVIHLMQTMFFELGFMEKFNIPVDTLREWLYEVYKHYNEVPFHNFRHCFCVAQMMYAITRQANLLQRLGDLECLILLVSCICHDLDHPGYNNIYQINARTELALRYNDISPLENHHCSIAFRLLEHPECNIFKNFSRETFNQIREGIIRCILATDMARHNEILTQFKEITPVFDYGNRAHINLLCMILIKVADISNEARPMDVAEPWLDRLLQEFFAQSAAEKSEGLPVTPFMDPDKVSKPGSQVRFIGLVLLPLFEALGDLVPELIELIIIPVRVALDYYKRLNDAQTKSRKSVADSATSENTSGASDSAAGSNAAGSNATGGANTGAGGNNSGTMSPQMPRSQSGISVKSRRSIPSQKSASRTSVDEPQGMPAELHDLPEGSESGDSETATEVDVAEKTSKFKVDTEGNASNRSKSSHSTSRKSSREKRPSMVGEMCSSGGGQRMRNSYGNIHGYPASRSHFGSNRAVSLDQYSTNYRRLSDGLQQVISDSNVFYNRHNRSSNEANAAGVKMGPSHLVEDMNMNAPVVMAVTQQPAAGHFHNLQNVPNMENASLAGGNTNTMPPTISNSNGVSNYSNMHAMHQLQQQQQQQQQLSSTNGNISPTHHTHYNMATQEAVVGVGNIAASNGIAAQAAASANAATSSNKSSWKARLKQFSDYFSFSFDKHGKRCGSTRSSPCSLRNNNAPNMQHVVGAGSGAAAGTNTAGGLIDPITGKPSICCTISNNLQSPGLLHKQHQELLNAGRHRAYSLDVPPCSRSNPRYSGSSSGGDGSMSRKSSRLDGIGSSATGDENNSNNTLHSSSGVGSDMPTCLPPPIRIGSVDASDTLVFVTGVPRVKTPANQHDAAEHATSISIDLSAGQAAEQPKI